MYQSQTSNHPRHALGVHIKLRAELNETPQEELCPFRGGGSFPPLNGRVSVQYPNAEGGQGGTFIKSPPLTRVSCY